MFFRKKNQPQSLLIHAPVTGKIINLSEVQDPVFAQGMLGTGFAIIPDYKNQDQVSFVTPFAGTLVTVFKTGHAYGIKDKTTGIECLVHIGIDTVELAGKWFNIKVKQGDNINHNEIMVSANLKAIKEEGKKLIVTPIVFANEMMEGYEFKLLKTEHVTQGQIVGEVIKV